jgi:cytochrome c peroxidase
MLAVPVLPVVASRATSAPPVPGQYQDAVLEADTHWSAERAALGRQLFQDRRLSRDGSMSCQDCHRPELAFTDGRRTAVGIAGKAGPRNTPTIVNRALGQAHFWDGRAATLEEQALGPIASPGEMALPVETAVARLSADASYRAAFRRAFGGPPTGARIAEAIAAYERTVYSVDAPFDRHLAGEPGALSASAARGLKLFGEKARCAECHTGINFTDELFHSLGVSGDKGRGGVSGQAAELGAFKTPTLREVARTAPYMHDGSVGTLAEVVDYYDRGCQPHPNLDPKIRQLGLTAQDKQDLVAFLESLSGKVVELQPDAAGAAPGGR